MNILFVGTGSALYNQKRFFSSLLITENNRKLLIDTGDGIVGQLDKLCIDVNSIDFITFTHLHPDHFSGFTSLISYMKLMKRTKPLSIIIHHTIREFIELLLNQVFLFSDRLGFQLYYQTFSDAEPLFINEIFSVNFLANQHLSKYSKYEKLNSINIKSFSLLIQNHGGFHAFYSGDVNNYSDLEEVYSIVRDYSPKYAIIEATHVSIGDIQKFFYSYNKAKVVFTHISENNEYELNTWFNSLNISEKERIIISYDGLILENNL